MSGAKALSITVTYQPDSARVAKAVKRILEWSLKDIESQSHQPEEQVEEHSGTQQRGRTTDAAVNAVAVEEGGK